MCEILIVTKMNKRLELFMRSENLTAVKLAEILQVQPSSISHLLSGRNKPNFDFVSRIMLMFPKLNPDWFVNNIGEMYRGASDRTDGHSSEDLHPESFNNAIENSSNQAQSPNSITNKNMETMEIREVTNVTSGDLFDPHHESNTSEADEQPYIMNSNDRHASQYSINEKNINSDNIQGESMGNTNLNLRPDVPLLSRNPVDSPTSATYIERVADMERPEVNSEKRAQSVQQQSLDSDPQNKHSEGINPLSDQTEVIIPPVVDKVMIMYSDKTFEVYNQR